MVKTDFSTAADIKNDPLVEIESHYHQIIDNLPVAIYSCDVQGYITQYNQSAADLWGREPEIGQDQWCGSLKIYQPDGALVPLDECPMAVAIKERRAVTGAEIIIEQPNGTRRIIVPHPRPIFSTTGELTGAVNMLEDVTERKSREEKVLRNAKELLKANQQLEKSNRELEQFAYIASHDLQEPLRKIQTFLELLNANYNNHEAFEKYFTKVNLAAQRMSRLISDVLNYSRLAVPASQFEDTDLNQVLKDVKSDFELLIEQKKVAIHADDLPVIKGMPLQLHQLFANLISNAIKFCDHKPEISINSRLLNTAEIKQEGLKENKNYVRLTFKDNGIGFDSEYSDQVFIIFKRLNNPQQYTGTGIGLALCKKIVENHGGTIKANSKKGEGAVITVTMPVSTDVNEKN